MMPFKLSRSQRLLHRSQFDGIYARGRILHHPGLRIHLQPNTEGFHRLGLSVPRRVGNAVRRNRYKRLIRESFRTLPNDGSSGYDLVITIRKHAPLSTQAYRELLREALQRAEQSNS